MMRKNLRLVAGLRAILLFTAVVLMGIAAIAATSQPAGQPSSQPAWGDEFNRPAYAGYGKFESESLTGLYKIQGLEELAGRWGLKPYEKLAAKKYPRTGRVIFRDFRTGASVWRITDNPFSMERHLYSNQPSWNCDGSLFVYTAAGSPPKLLTGDLSAEVDIPQDRVGRWYKGAHDTRRPTLFYCYDPKRGIVKEDVISGASEVLYPAEKFEPFFKEFPNRPPHVGISNLTPDGQFIVGRAGGASDEGVTFFGAKTDGSELRIARVPEGCGIHNLQAMATERPLVNLSLHGVYTGLALHELDTGKCTKYPNAKGHGAWRPGTLIKAHEAGGRGVHLTDLETGKDLMVLDAAFFEDYFTWLADDPDWLYFAGRTRTGDDIVQVKTDTSMTAMRICTMAPMHPQFGTYNNLSFIASSPDGTKVQFTSTMLGSIDEYLVVANSPQRPREVAVSRDGDKAKLTWKPPHRSKEIAGYMVYRSDESGKAKTCITDAPVKGPALEVQPPEKGKAHYYAVTSIERSGLESIYSEEACVSSSPEEWPGDVRVYLEAEDGLMTLPVRPAFGPVVASNGHYAWQTKEGEEGTVTLNVNVPKAGKYYFIGRVSGNTTASPLMLQVDGGDKAPLTKSVPEEDWQWVVWSAADKPYAVELAKGAHQIELSTTHNRSAIDELMVTTDPKWSPQRYGTCDEKAPEPVGGLKAVESDTYDIALTWESSRETDIHHYNVYASTGKTVEPVQKNLIASPAAGPFLDWGLRPDTEYCYAVTVVDRQGNESRPSASVVVKTSPHAGKATTHEWDVTDKDPQGKDAASVSFETSDKGQFVIWALVKGVIKQGVKGAGAVDLSLDGKGPGAWTILYDQVGLNGGPNKDSDWVWCPFAVTKQKAYGPALIDIDAGRHEIKMSSTYFRIARIVVSNDLSFRPTGKLNTFYR